MLLFLRKLRALLIDLQTAAATDLVGVAETLARDVASQSGLNFLTGIAMAMTATSRYALERRARAAWLWMALTGV